MSGKSKIEWTGTTWNPVTGCDKVSQGCKFCYAERIAKRLKAMGQKKYANEFKVTLHPELLEEPLRWKKPQLVFVNSMSDLFHEEVPWEFIVKVFFTMYEAKQHIFQILTKRQDRLMQFREYTRQILRERGLSDWEEGFITAQNIWIGVSVEDQENADKRREALRQISNWGWNTFVSYEPALGNVNWVGWEFTKWLIVGGESGLRARPMHPDWARGARDWAVKNRVAFFFKQWGKYLPFDHCADVGIKMRIEDAMNYAQTGAPVKVGKKKAGCLLDGTEWKEYPEGMK